MGFNSAFKGLKCGLFLETVQNSYSCACFMHYMLFAQCGKNGWAGPVLITIVQSAFMRELLSCAKCMLFSVNGF